MRLAREQDIPVMLDMLHDDIMKCIYIYINLQVYGVSNPNVPVWVYESEGGIQAIIMKYFDALRIYSLKEDDDACFDKICEMVGKTPHRLLFTTYSLAQKLNERFKEKYKMEKSAMLHLAKHRNFDFSNVEPARESDVPEIVSLILDDDFYKGQFDPAVLEAEMIDRMRTNMGYSYIIRKDGKIVAHDSILAQAGDIATLGFLICHRDYRNQFLGETLESYFIKQMNDQGKRLYASILDERRLKMLEKSRNPLIEYCGRMVNLDY